MKTFWSSGLKNTISCLLASPFKTKVFHISSTYYKMCREAGQKLIWDSAHPDTKKRKAKYTTTVKSQFNYCPLVWKFCTRRSNKLINKVQERALRINCNDQLTYFKSLLLNHNEITTHQRNFQVLMTQIY